MKKTMKQHAAADEVLARKKENDRKRAKSYRERKRQENQSARHVTQTSDDPLAAARRFLAEIEGHH
jgi:hypothetical protein